jgi:ferric-dicitrate binding protein FerR (iron transport regulator)
MNTLSVNKALLFQYFAGSATPVQKRLISEWLAQAENQELYFEWLLEWQSRSPHYLADGTMRYEQYVDYMRKNPRERLMATASPERPTGELTSTAALRHGRNWFMAAALVLMIGTAGWFGRNHFIYKTYETAFGETKRVRLSDGTKVILNANSSLKVPRFGFGDKTREVKLNGEAFFTVTHTIDNKRFMVKTDDHFEVMVLGTEFSVYTRQKGGKVLLKKGKVHVLYSDRQGKKELVMKPGDLITMEESSAKPKLKPNADTKKLTAWTGNRFVFDKTPLSEVASQLQEHYGIRVQIKDGTFASRTVSGTFQPESGEELLTLLSELFDFRLTREGESYLILQK